MTKRAFFWVAWGQKHLEEAYVSTESVKRLMPDIPRFLYTRRKEQAAGCGAGLFDGVLAPSFSGRLKHAHPMLHGLRYRVDAVNQLADFDELFFLDSDTYLCKPVYELFEMLNRFDFMMSLSAGLRLRNGGPRMPDSFPQYNSGVVIFKSDERGVAFHNRWLDLYMEHRYQFKNTNQRPLREAIWTDETGLLFYVLPAEYNLRFRTGGWVSKTVMILHGRSDKLSYPEVEAIVNERAGRMRSWGAWEIG